MTDWSAYWVVISFDPYWGLMVVSKEFTSWMNLEPKGHRLDFSGLKLIGVCFDPVLHTPPH